MSPVPILLPVPNYNRMPLPVPTDQPTIAVKGQSVNLEPEYGQWIQMRDGFHVFTRTWSVPRDRQILATITFIHGLGEHIDRYDQYLKRFANAGFQVFGYDQRGFGRTGLKYGINKLGFTWGMDTALDDIKEMLDRNTIKNVPRYLYGHSMGGLYVLSFLLKHGNSVSLQGVVSSSPAIQSCKEIRPHPILVSLLRLSIPLTKSWLIINNPLDPRGLSHDESEIASYSSDPLIHPMISVSHADQVLRAGDQLVNMTKDQISSLFPSQTPILLVHGSKDPITDPTASTSFASKAQQQQGKNVVPVTLVKYNDMLHELHNEPQVRDQLFEQVLAWLMKQLPNAV